MGSVHSLFASSSLFRKMRAFSAAGLLPAVNPQAAIESGFAEARFVQRLLKRDVLALPRLYHGGKSRGNRRLRAAESHSLGLSPGDALCLLSAADLFGALVCGG